MPYRKYGAEALGTFALTFVVWLSLVYPMPLSIPLIAPITLGLFVYMVGGISGAHLNPAVTVGMLSIGKIKTNDAVIYVICQFAGAAIALTLGRIMADTVPEVTFQNTMMTGIAEAIGTFFLSFAVASVTTQKVPPAASGLVVGGSLMLGIFMAYQFSNAVLNPAVALGIGSFGIMYILGPVVGAICGAWARDQLDK